MGTPINKDISVLAKYFFWHKDLKTRGTEDAIKQWLSKKFPKVSATRWNYAIGHSIDLAKKHRLIEVDSIPITRTELDTILKFQKKQIRRLLFTLICVAKFNTLVKPETDYWIYQDRSELFTLANIMATIRRQDLMMKDLKELGFITFAKSVSNLNVRVECIDDGEPVIRIRDLRNLGFQFESHTGGNYTECAICGLTIPRGSNRQTYCDVCNPDNRPR